MVTGKPSAPPSGARRPRADSSFTEFVIEQLCGLRAVRAQAMFGGWGLYAEEVFFGIVWAGRLFLKTDERSRARYEAHGMKPFRPNPRQTLRTYYEVPADVLDDATKLECWARDAVQATPDVRKRGSAASE